jgi:acyl carrier protein
MDEADIYRGLKDVFADVFGRDDIVLNASTTARDVSGWDSFRQIEIVVAVELRFGVRFRTRDLDALSNVGDLVRLIHTNTKAKSASHDRQ